MQRKFIKNSLLLFLFIIIVGLLWVIFHQTLPTAFVTTIPLPNKTILTTQKIKSSLYKEGRLTEIISADNITVRSRRFGLFRFRNMNEMVIRNLSVDFCLEQNGGNSTVRQSLLGSIQNGFQDTADSTQHSSRIGRITAVTIEGFHYVSRGPSQLIYLECEAKRGEMKQNSKKLKLINCILMQPANAKKIVAKKAYWDEEAQRFEINGSYKIITPTGTTSGTGLAIDLYFKCDDLNQDVGN